MLKSFRTTLSRMIAPKQASPFTDDRLWQTAYPAPWLAGTNTTGVQVTQDNALTYTAFFRCVTLIAAHIAMMPVTMDAPEADGDGRESIEIPVVSDWFRLGPNDDVSWGTFAETLTIHALTWGNGYAEITRRVNGRAVSATIITPNRVRPMRLTDGTLVYRVWPLDGTTQARTVLAEDMIHIKCPGWDGLVGYSPVQMFMQALGLGLATERFGGSFFGRAAMPAGVLEYEGELGPEDKEKMQEDWAAMYGGSAPVSRIAVLEGGRWKFTPLSISNDVAQFLETREFQVHEMGRIFGVPPHMLGETGGAPRANVQQASIEYVRDCLMPWAQRWENELTRKVVAQEVKGGRARLDTGVLMRADDVARSQFYKTMFLIGAKSVNDIMQDEGLDKIDGPEGDQRFVPLNMVPLDQAAAIARANAAAGKSGGSPTGEPGAEPGGPGEPQPKDEPAPEGG